MQNHQSITDEVKIGIGSQTEARLAKKILKGYSNITVVKIENRMKDGGCLYGLKLNRKDLAAVVRELRDNHIYSGIISQ